MPSQNPDSIDLLRYSINELIDCMKAQFQYSAMQERVLLDISSRLSCVEESVDECRESNDFAVRKVHELTHQAYRQEQKREMDWESQPSYYSSEGESNADFMQRKE